MVASAHPDGLEKLARDIGIASRERVLLATPLADYQAGFFASPWLRKAAAGLAGLALILGACLLLGRFAARKRGGA